MPESVLESQNTENGVIVIGGGLAGISAALALAKAGKSVTLLEAKRRLGGRAGSFTATNEHGRDESVDYCQHVGMGCCHGLRQLIRWLGQEDSWEEQSQLHFYGPNGDYRRLSALPLLPAPLHLSGWLLAWPGLDWRDRLSVALGMWHIGKLKLDDSLDQFSALDWLKANRQTPRAIEHFWSTIIVSALGEEIDRVSLAAVCKVLQDGFLNDRQAFHLLVPKRSLDRLFNQDAGLVLRELGVDVRLSTPVKQVEKRGNEISVSCGEELRAGAVICAVPWHKISQIEWLECGEQLPDFETLGHGLASSPITGVHTWWDSAWLPTAHAAIVGRLCQWVFPKAMLDSKDGSTEGASTATKTQVFEHYYQIVISASRKLFVSGSQDIGNLLREDLGDVFPASKQANLLRYKTVTDPQAVFSVVPGANQFRPQSRTTVEGLWLAGDWTLTGWPSTMEGAILSGLEAAECVIRSH